MKNKTLISIIGLLSFALITFFLINNMKQPDTSAIEEANKKNEILSEKIRKLESVEKENIEINEQLSKITAENEMLNETITETNINTVLLTGTEIDGSILNMKVTYININVCRECQHGYEFIKVEEETSKTIKKEVPIYLLDESNTLFKVEWEKLVDLGRNPVLLLFESNNEVLFIREEYHPLRLKGKEIQESLIHSLVE
ncbi:hypothetical protein [Ornithinibacillus xuwenensis]|uniref:Thioredoxin domain-containing protein n=1 Tax=Ornithinibacillus xuwenensis TaxID=3144668 RepID=A0ABU9XGX4_9BACI